MRLCLQFVWSLNDIDQTREEWRRIFIFKKIREMLIYTFEYFLESLWWSMFLLKFQTLLCCFLVCFAKMCVMLRSWSLFIEFLSLCSRWRVTAGLMPRVLGPANFHLKFWANWNTSECCCVLENTSECCCVHQDLHLGSCGWTVRYASGLLQMNVTWISGLYLKICIVRLQNVVRSYLLWNLSRSACRIS